MLIRRFESGFSLIECMVALAIFSLLALLAMPSFSSAIQDAQIRSAAQSITSGLQLARAEAIRRNVSVRFRFSNTLGGNGVDGGTDWKIEADSGSNATVPSYTIFVQENNGKDGSANARVGVKNIRGFTTATTPIDAVKDIVFSALGRVSVPYTQIDVRNATDRTGTARRLSITVTGSGQVRLCDPKVEVSVNPQGCT